MNEKRKSGYPATTEITAKDKDNRQPSCLYKFNTKLIKMQGVFNTILIVSLLVIVTMLYVESDQREYIPIEHTVSSGETLTTIAYKYKPDDVVLQDYMAWVYEHNESGIIYPGDKVIMAEVK